MTAYLVWRGMRLDSIGVWRGVSAAVGLAGTVVYSFLSTRMGLVDTGMLSVTFQFVCLSLSFVSLFIEDFNVSSAMLIAGVCASRVGLWVFDISVTQVSFGTRKFRRQTRRIFTLH
jgi:solute carrier family 40 (iron-regulated transporter), member 1